MDHLNISGCPDENLAFSDAQVAIFDIMRNEPRKAKEKGTNWAFVHPPNLEPITGFHLVLILYMWIT